MVFSKFPFKILKVESPVKISMLVVNHVILNKFSLYLAFTQNQFSLCHIGVFKKVGDAQFTQSLPFVIGHILKSKGSFSVVPV